jgi:hypothetical protein
MDVPNVLLVICFVVLMALGALLLYVAVTRLTKKSTKSQVKLPFLQIEMSGPAWLVAALFGIVMLASPVLAAAFQQAESVTAPPPPASVQQVRNVPEPNYASFRFTRDTSILDLRAVGEAPWYTALPGWGLIEKKPRIRPAVLKNYMVVRKIAPADRLHLTYGTSGKLDVRCVTHSATYRRAERVQGETTVETWEVIADVSAIPVGQEFEVAVEATYWNAFRGPKGDDYTTYAHEQTEPEELSVMLFFPDEKSFKDIAVTEYGPSDSTGRPFQGQSRSWIGEQKRTYFWTTASNRPSWYYKVAWTW